MNEAGNLADRGNTPRPTAAHALVLMSFVATMIVSFMIMVVRNLAGERLAVDLQDDNPLGSGFHPLVQLGLSGSKS